VANCWGGLLINSSSAVLSKVAHLKCQYILLALEELVNGTQKLCKQYIYNLRSSAAQAAQPLAASRREAPPYTNSSFRIGIYKLTHGE